MAGLDAASDLQRRQGALPILVVDDDTAIAEVVSEILADEGFTVLAAGNGLDALRIIEAQPLAMVLVDRSMPLLSGTELALTMQRRGLDVPIVALTAASESGDWAREIAAAAVLQKPFEIHALLRTVEAILRRG